MPVFWNSDLRETLRGARRAPGFYASAVLTLAIGMAGATIIFTLVRGILLRPFPLPGEDRLVVSWRMPPDGPTHVPYRAADVEEIGRSSRGFAAVAGVGYNGAWEHVWLDGDTALTAQTAVVMGELFTVLGASPVLGRPLSAADDREGAERAVVLSHAGWQRVFGGDPAVVGRRLVTGKRGFVVVGVMPPDLEYPRGVEIWTTRWALASDEPNSEFRESLLRDVEIVARLRPETSLAQAAEELGAMTARLDAQGAGANRFVSFRPVVHRFKDVVIGDIGQALSILLAAVGLLLFIAGANVANLLLVRGEARRTELVVRAALGAGRGRIMRQQLAESLLVTACAAVVGVVVATLGLRTVTTLVPDGLPRLESIRVDWVVVAFATVTTFVVRRLRRPRAGARGSFLDLAAALRAGAAAFAAPWGSAGGEPWWSTQVALAVAARGRGRAADAQPAAAAVDRHGLRPRSPGARRARRAHGAPGRAAPAVPGRRARPAGRACPGSTRRRPSTPSRSPALWGGTCRVSPPKARPEPQVAANPSLNFEAVLPELLLDPGRRDPTRPRLHARRPQGRAAGRRRGRSDGRAHLARAGPDRPSGQVRRPSVPQRVVQRRRRGGDDALPRARGRRGRACTCPPSS